MSRRLATLGTCAVAVLTFAASTAVRAAPITIGAFSSQDELITFDTPLPATGGPVSYEGVTISTSSGQVSTGNYGNMHNFPGASSGAALYDNVFASNLTIGFPQPVNRVGMLLAGGNSATSWTVQIRDAAGAVIESTVATFTVTVGFPNDPPVFVGLASEVPIASVRIIEANANGQYTGLDDLRFGWSSFATLLRTTPLSAGDARCPNGGVLVETGLDDGSGDGTANDGILSGGEVDASEAVCNGRDGFSALIDTTAIPAGDATCPNGGTRIDVGVDDGEGGGTAGDGVLDADEIDDSSMICNGTDGADGMPGANGAPGANGRDGADGADGGCSATGGGTGFLAALLVLLVAGLRRRGASAELHG